MTVTWTATFDDTGGYDCMTGAFSILRDGVLVFKVDLADFGQELCAYDETTAEKARPTVEFILAALNEKESR